jgi:CRP/FNR family transcriptional regulator, dissimilatory nitrate respiration regulator
MPPKSVPSIPLFDGLPQDQSADLESICLRKFFPRGATIFSEGDSANGFYVVSDGKVKIFKNSADGKEQILHIFGSGEPFGEVPVFEGGRFPAHAVALEDAKLIFVPRAAFVELIKRNPSLALNMLGMLSRRLRRFTALVEDLSLKEVPGRLAAYILYLSEKSTCQSGVVLDISKGQLAALLGTIPETLSRILNKMTKQGLVTIDGPKIAVLDMDGLKDLADGAKRL